MIEGYGRSASRACRLISLCRATWRYQPRPRDDRALRKRLREIAEERRAFGSPRLVVMLRREGFRDNHKRIERIYKEEGFEFAP